MRKRFIYAITLTSFLLMSQIGFGQNKDLKELKTRNWSIGLNFYSPKTRYFIERGPGRDPNTSSELVRNANFGFGLNLSYRGWTVNYFHHIQYVETDKWATTGGIYPQFAYREYNPRLHLTHVLGLLNFGYQYAFGYHSKIEDQFYPLVGAYIGPDNLEFSMGFTYNRFNFLLGAIFQTNESFFKTALSIGGDEFLEQVRAQYFMENFRYIYDAPVDQLTHNITLRIQYQF